MTAPQPATPGSDSVRAQIAEALRQHAWEPPSGESVRPGAPCMDCGEYPGARHGSNLTCPRVLADVLVPVVNALRAEAKAEALEEAAAWLADPGSNGAPEIASNGAQLSLAPLTWMVRSLRDRAAAYRTNPSSEETHRGE